MLHLGGSVWESVTAGGQMLQRRWRKGMISSAHMGEPWHWSPAGTWSGDDGFDMCHFTPPLEMAKILSISERGRLGALSNISHSEQKVALYGYYFFIHYILFSYHLHFQITT